jgi:hypothetical protein
MVAGVDGGKGKLGSRRDGSGCERKGWGIEREDEVSNECVTILFLFLFLEKMHALCVRWMVIRLRPKLLFPLGFLN